MIEPDYYAELGARDKCRWHEHVSICLIYMQRTNPLDRQWGAECISIGSHDKGWQVIDEDGD